MKTKDIQALKNINEVILKPGGWRTSAEVLDEIIGRMEEDLKSKRVKLRKIHAAANREFKKWQKLNPVR